MADLTQRAERALLGALLSDPDQISSVPFVTAADFATTQHRAVFTAIAAVHAGRLNGSLSPADLVVSLAAQQPEFSVQELGELADSCPHPANAPAYARMVAEASLRRSVAVHAERLVEDATQLNREIGRVPAAAKPGHGAEAFPAHLLKLAHAMMRHAWGFDQEPAKSAETPHAAHQPGEGQARQEEEVLADLIRHFRQNSNVVNWLPAEAFTPGPRREVYQAITALARSGEPVEVLTVDWQLGRNQAAVRPAGSGPAPPRPEAGYVAGLNALPVTVGTATLTGRLLLNQHAAAQLRTRPAHRENGHRPSSSPAPATMHGPAEPRPARRPLHLATPPPLLPPPPGNDRQPNPPGPEPRP